NQRLGQLEVARRRKALHDVALGAATYPLADLALEVAVNVLAHRGDIAIGLAEFTREIGIDGRQHGFLDLDDGDLEAGGLAGELLRAVVLGKGHRAGAGFPRLHAAHGALEICPPATFAEDEGETFGRAALEGDVVDLADEVDRGLVAVSRRPLDFVPRDPLLAQDLDRLVDL